MLKVATEFAELLDQNLFDEASALMAENCRYRYYEGEYVGPSVIANMYRMLDKQSREVLQEYKTITDVRPVSDRQFVLHSTSHMRIDEFRHESSFEEVIEVEEGRVVSIEYREIPGEAEKLREFYRSAGLLR